MPFLFIFTIGSVQDFIAGSRRSRDLWFSSWLISDLSRIAALTIRAHGNLIFPIDGTDLDIGTREVVNRIIAEVDGIAPHVLGERVEGAIQTRLSTHAKVVLTGIQWPEQSEDEQKRAQSQINDSVDYAWAAVPRMGSYVNDRALLESVIAARKATRTFSQLEGAAVPKSSLDGVRESVIPERLYPSRRDTAEQRQHKIDALYRRFGAKQGERLSAVDLIKRRGNRDDVRRNEGHADFPSTSHIAALPFLSRLERTPAHAQAIEAFITRLRSLHVQPETLDQRYARLQLFGRYDASLLFANRLAEDLQPKQNEQAQQTIDQAQQALEDLYATFGVGTRRPSPYYALLHADGDNMGKAIDTLTSIHDHQALSGALDRFAREVRGVVESETHRGALVYAGGDDVLAFLPLDTVVQCARALEQAFAKAMNDFRTSLDETTRDALYLPTLSIGIAICHHLESLADTLQLAREAERKAKDLPNKHGLAITVSKRSGADRTVVGSWDRTEHDIAPLYQRLQQLTGLHMRNAIPDGAAYELRDLMQRLPDAPAAALRAEAIRIVKRKRGEQGIAEHANADLVALAELLPTSAVPTTHEYWNIACFADELIVARELARAGAIFGTDDDIDSKEKHS